MTVPFRQDVFGGSSVLELSVAWGADTVGDPTGAGWTWTDETANVYFVDKIKYNPGRSDEASQASPCNLNFTLLNTAHLYTPYDPSAGRFPNVVRKTPVRVRLNLGAGAVLLAQTFAIGFTPTWDTSGKLALVKVASAGILRWIGKRKTPLKSALFRANTNAAPSYYWAFEDGTNSTSAASALVGGPAITATSGTFGFAKQGASGGSDVQSEPDSALHSAGAYVALAATTGWTIGFRFRATTSSPGAFQRTAVMLNITDPTYKAWTVSIQDGGRGVVLNPTFKDGTADFPVLSAIVGATTIVDGNWHYVLVRSSISGGSVTYTSFVDGVQQDTLTRATTGAGPVTRVNIGDSDDANMVPSNVSAWGFGHLALWQSVTVNQATLASAATGWLGETAAARMARVAAENNVPLTQIGTSSMPMGPQPVDTLMNILTECTTADGGFMYDGRGPGIGVAWLASRYNVAPAFTADVPSSQLSPPYAPIDDDQNARNYMVASRVNGSDAIAFDNTSPLGIQAIGTQDASITVNVATDAPLPNIASWGVHTGTVLGLRYPTLVFDFATTASALAASFLAAADLGFRIDVTGVHTAVPTAPPDTVSVLTEGYAAVIDPFSFSVVFNCSPFAPWRVVQLDDATYGRLANGTSTVQTLINTSATSLSIASTGALWSTTATPYDLNLDGERVTCTVMAGAASPQTATITRSVNGVVASHAAGRPVELWQPLVVAL